MGSGVTATRHALDVKFGVRIPAPQQNTTLRLGIKGALEAEGSFYSFQQSTKRTGETKNRVGAYAPTLFLGKF